MSPNWLNVAGCDVLSQEVRKFQLCLISDNTKDILPITGTKTNHPKRCESFNSLWYWTTQKIFYRLKEPKQIIPKGVKVSTLFDIGQHKRYFTDYRNHQNKSSRKVWKFQLSLILDNTQDILPISGTKTNHPRRWGRWRRRRHHSPPILGGVMRKAPIVHNLKWLIFFCNIFQMEA
jgi:hypothetical protein